MENPPLGLNSEKQHKYIITALKKWNQTDEINKI